MSNNNAFSLSLNNDDVIFVLCCNKAVPEIGISKHRLVYSSLLAVEKNANAIEADFMVFTYSSPL